MNSKKEQRGAGSLHGALASGVSPYRYRSAVASLLGLNVSDGGVMPPVSIQRKTGVSYGSETLTERPYMRGQSRNEGHCARQGEEAAPLDRSRYISTVQDNASFETLRSAGREEGACGLKNDASPQSTVVDASPEAAVVDESGMPASQGIGIDLLKSKEIKEGLTGLFSSIKEGCVYYGTARVSDQREAGAARIPSAPERGSWRDSEMDAAQKEAIMDVEVQGRQTRPRYKVEKSPQEILPGEFIGRPKSDTPEKLSAGHFKTTNTSVETLRSEAGRSGAREGFLRSSLKSSKTSPDRLSVRSGSEKMGRVIFSETPAMAKHTVTPEIEKLRRALRDMSSRFSRQQADIKNEKKQEERRNNIQPPAAQPEVVFREVSRKTGTPCAFWERSSLGRFNLKPLR